MNGHDDRGPVLLLPEQGVRLRESDRTSERMASLLTRDLGHFGAAWWSAVGGLLLVMGFGAFAYAQQLIYGDVVTGMRTIGAGGATWGLYIVFDAFFVGISFAGISVAAAIRLFGIEKLRPLSRMALLLTIVSLMLGGLCVLADLGQPFKGLLNLPQFARPSSPFFGTFSLVIGGYLFASLVFFFLTGRADAAACVSRGTRFGAFHRLWASGYRGSAAEQDRHRRVSFWLSLLILPLLVSAHSTLGFIFGTQGGRPGWFNALQGPGFIVLAGISGIGTLLILAAACRKYLRLEDAIPVETFGWLCNLLLVLTSIYLYFMVAEEVTANYAALASETRIAHEVVFGSYAPMFWSVVACLVGSFVILFRLFLRRQSSIGWAVTAGILVNVAAVLKRYLIVVPSQTHGSLLPFPEGVYRPTWVEFGTVLGLIAFGTLVFLVFAKIFPIVPLVEPAAEERGKMESPRNERIRRLLFVAVLLMGLVMAGTGLLFSARWGTDPILDPVLPYSPALFIAGIIVCFLSSVVYEVLPGRSAGREYRPGGELVRP